MHFKNIKYSSLLFDTNTAEFCCGSYLLVFPLHLHQLSLHLGLFLLHLDQLLVFSLHLFLLPGHLQQRFHLQMHMSRCFTRWSLMINYDYLPAQTPTRVQTQTFTFVKSLHHCQWRSFKYAAQFLWRTFRALSCCCFFANALKHHNKRGREQRPSQTTVESSSWNLI